MLCGRYNKIFVDAFWNSRAQSFPMHLLTLMCSWAVVCDVWYLQPQTRRPGETAIEFSERVKRMIGERAGLKNVNWDGYLKHFRASSRYMKEQQTRVADEMKRRWRAVEERRTREEGGGGGGGTSLGKGEEQKEVQDVHEDGEGDEGQEQGGGNISRISRRSSAHTDSGLGGDEADGHSSSASTRQHRARRSSSRKRTAPR